MLFARFITFFALAMVMADDSSCQGMNFFERLMSGCDNVSIFQPTEYDLSMTFLRMIFGSVGGALYGMSNPLVGTIFRVFNTGVLMVVALLITYTVFLTVVGSSQDGSSMGGNSKGILNPWVMTRIVLGSAMLIPSFSGYSGMQVLVMYFVVQGVGFADSVWRAALDYIASTGNSVVATPVEYTNPNLNTLVAPNGMMDNIYKSALCMTYQMQMSSATCTSQPSTCQVQYSFSASYDQVNTTFPFSCGSYVLNISAITGSQDPSVNQKYAGIMQAAWSQSINILISASQSAMQSAETTLTAYTNQPYSAAVPALNASSSCTAQSCPPATAYASAASGYLGVVDYVYQTLHPPANLDSNTSWTESATQRGWIAAGMYYFDLGQNYSTGSGQYSSSSAASAPLLTSTGPYIMTGSPPAMPPAPSSSNIVSPMQIQDAYYFNYQQTQCSQSCSAVPTPSCDSCQASSLVNRATGTDSPSAKAASAQADAMYTGLMHNMMVLLYNIDTYNYCGLLPTGIAAGFATLNQCAMIMPIARYNRLVLGGTARVLTGMNLGWWTANTDSFGNSCDQNWNHDMANQVANIMTHGSSSNTSACLSKADACRNASGNQIMTACSYNALYSSCMAGQYGFFPSMYLVASGGYMDPIYASSQMGMELIAIAVNYWTSVTQDVFSNVLSASWAFWGISMGVQIPADVAAAALYGNNPAGGGLAYAMAQAIISIVKMFFELSKAVLEMYLPLGASLTTVVFGLGVLMGLYMPFMPFMLFLFGVVGWVMAVIEAMVAAPLVALGVTHPEGHDLLGKSEQAVMLLLGVFVRPVAMVMGLLFAMNLSQLAVQLLNYGFLYVFTDMGGMNQSAGDAITNGFILLGALMVYGYVLMTIIDQSYSLIYQIPDRLLRWIGGPQDNSSSAQMVQQIKGQVQQIGGKAGEAGSGVAGHAPTLGAQQAQGSQYRRNAIPAGEGNDTAMNATNAQ